MTQVTRLLQAASQAILLNHVSLLETEVSKCICPVKYRCTCSVKYVSRKLLRGFHSLNTGSKAPVWTAFQYISEILLHIDGKTFFVCSFVAVCVHLKPWYFVIIVVFICLFFVGLLLVCQKKLFFMERNQYLLICTLAIPLKIVTSQKNISSNAKWNELIYFAVLVIKYTVETILTGTFWYKETFVSVETNSFPGGSKSRFSFGKILFRA